MNWEDTVMHIEDLCGNRLPRTYSEMKMNLDKQAEITWSIAEKAGIKKMKDWIETHQCGLCIGQDMQDSAGNTCKYGNTSHLLLPWLEYQAFLEVEK